MTVPNVDVGSETPIDDDHCLDVASVSVQRAAPSNDLKPFRLAIVEAAKQAVNIDVLPSDTIQFVKDVIWASEGIPQNKQRLELRGKILAAEMTLSDVGANELTTITLHKTDVQTLALPAWSLRPSSPPLAFTGRGQRGRSKSPLSLFHRKTEAEKQGLQPRATATAACDWDGKIPKGPAGLKIKKEESVTIGRVVDARWYQGYINANEVGYIPRNFVNITQVLDESIIPELGTDAPSTPKPTPTLPPTPFLSNSDRAEYDVTDKHARVAVVFAPTLTLEPPFPLTILLTLVAGPGRRIAHATFRCTFPDGAITTLSPSDYTSAVTEVHHNDSAGGEIELNVGTAGTLPAQVATAVKHNKTHSEEYARTTWGRIQGSGINLREAYWVFEEDQGKGGRHGIPVAKSTETLMLGLSVRPAMCEYEVEVTVVEGDGEAPGFFNTRTHRSGLQRVLLV